MDKSKEKKTWDIQYRINVIQRNISPASDNADQYENDSSRTSVNQ